MKSGIILTAGDPRTQAELAREAEAAGWDGVFTWDGIAIPGMDSYDPWVLLGALALTTERVTLGAIVTPPSRRRPWKLAHEAMTVDRLSGGRLVLPVGLGALDDAAFGNVGEATEARTRAELLDESLAILSGLWTGEPFGFEGDHFRFGPMTLRPTPVQRPRIPIWVVAVPSSDRSMQRAARWDGIVTQPEHPNGLAEITAWLDRERPTWRTDGFEVVAQGSTPPNHERAAAITGPWADAGATWWLDADWTGATTSSLRDRIVAGPPGLSGGSSSG